MLDAPRFRVQALLDDHLRPQATLRDCRDSGRPFALFLRTVATEHRTERTETLFASHISTDSVRFQRWLSGWLAPRGIPLVNLHGGSDALISDLDGHGNVLSTHAANWEAVATELIQSASVIVLLISH